MALRVYPNENNVAIAPKGMSLRASGTEEFRHAFLAADARIGNPANVRFCPKVGISID